MTTIAAKAGQIASDTQATGDYMLRVQKIVNLPDGGVAGGCGHWSRAWAGLQWLVGGEEGPPPKIKGAALLIVRPDGSLWLAEDEFPAYPLLDKFAAIGAGAQAAMAAMDGGADAVKAVQVACKLDAYTSAPVQVLSISPKKGRKK